MGDPNAWSLNRDNYTRSTSWFYNPRYTADLQIYEIPAELRVNLERYRMEVDPNPDNWAQRYNGQWQYYPEGNPSFNQKEDVRKLRENKKVEKQKKKD